MYFSLNLSFFSLIAAIKDETKESQGKLKNEPYEENAVVNIYLVKEVTGVFEEVLYLKHVFCQIYIVLPRFIKFI